MKVKKIFLIYLLNISIMFSASISGKVLDEVTKEPLIGANVYIEGSDIGTATDTDGYFFLSNIERGQYQVVISYISYETINQTINVTDEVKDIKFFLKVSALKTSEVNVVGVVKKSNEVKKILDQKESQDILNTFTSEELRKSGDSNASEALKRVTGVSIVEGNNDVVIRGLGDRYSQARINSLTMPSTDPDKRNLPLNLFPAKIIEKIDVYKSYHPKLPGNFAGGSVDVVTKSYPDEFTIKFSVGNSTNSKLNIDNIYLSNNGHVNLLGDYSDFALDLSENKFGSGYIFEKTPDFFQNYHQTASNIDLENMIFDEFLYDPQYADIVNIEDFQSIGLNSAEGVPVWDWFYYNKLSANSRELNGSYKRSNINENDLEIFGVRLPKSPVSYSFMNGNKFQFSENIEFGYFLNTNYSNKYGTDSKDLSEYAARTVNETEMLVPEYSLTQFKNSFNTNLSSLVSTGLKLKSNENYIKADYNFMGIRTSKNESMSVMTNDTWRELDDGGVSLSDKISQKEIDSHHLTLETKYKLSNKINLKFDVYYNDSYSELNMPDMRQHTYYNNKFTPNGIWDAAESYIDQNGIYDDGEEFIDSNSNGIYDNGEEFEDIIGNGQYDAAESYIDQNGVWDEGEIFIDIGDGYWNNSELYNDTGLYDSNTGSYIGSNNNQWDFIDLNGDGICNNNADNNGDGFSGSFADQECELFNDLGNGQYDEGEDFIDTIGNGQYDDGEEFTDLNNNGLFDPIGESFIDVNGDGIWNPDEQFEDNNGNGVWDEGEILIQEYIDYNNEKYEYIRLVQGEGENGVKPTKRTWIYGGEDQEVFGLNYSIDFQASDLTKFNLLLGFEDISKDRSFSKREFVIGTNSQIVNLDDSDLVFNSNINYAGSIFDQEDLYASLESNGIYDDGEEFIDSNSNGIYDDGEDFFDLSLKNGLYIIENSADAMNNSYSALENLTSGYFLLTSEKKDFLKFESVALSFGARIEDYNLYMQPFNTVTGEFLSSKTIIDPNEQYDFGESFIDIGNGIYDFGETYIDDNNNGIWDVGESFTDTGNGVFDPGFEIFEDSNGDGAWSPSEPFVDEVNGIYDDGEEFIDSNSNGIYDAGELWQDAVNGVWDEGEQFVDLSPTYIINANKDEVMLLPVFNLILSPNNLVNYRLSASKTLARPQYRELAPTKYEQFYNDKAIEGNPNLKTTRITNLDFRFEYYPSLTNMYSLAIYKKVFSNPIAIVTKSGSSHSYRSYANAKSAEVFGLELEFISKLKFIPPSFGKFSAGSNISYTNSSIESYPSFTDFNGNVWVDQSNAKKRPMIGQSNLIFNGNIGWSNWKNNLDISLSYNYYSKRLITIGIGVIPDEYEYPRPDLNFTMRYKFNDMSISLKIKNLLDYETRLGVEHDNLIYYTSKYKPGVSYNFSIQYGF